MKISFFAVNNFRGISGGLEKNKIIFKDTNTLFIYGQNNVGKSSFLKAYEFLYDNSTPTKDDFQKRKLSSPIEFELEVSLDAFDKARIEKNAPKQKDSYKKYLKDDVMRIKKTWYENGGKIVSKNQTYDFAAGNYSDIGYASIGLHSVFQSCMPKPIFIKAMPSEEEAKKILNDILKMMAESTLKTEDLQALKDAQEKIRELQEKMYHPETIALYESSVNTYFNRIFDDTKIVFKDQKDRVIWTENKLGKEFDIEFKKQTLDGLVDEDIPSSSDKIGHGTIRTAIFTLLLMKDVAEKFERMPGRKDYMVLFEEPELFLYPKIVSELRDLIYQVSLDDLPYQVLCASHSSAMIDLSKPKSSIIRLVKINNNTRIHQINDDFLKEAKNIKTNEELKQEMYEVLRFNPFICESFYADEVILIEGPTEEIIARAYFQEYKTSKNIYVLNCGTVNNMPFYQKIFSKFNIKYHVIFDTDKALVCGVDALGNDIFDSGIQKSICEQFAKDVKAMNGNVGVLRTHHVTFEPAHCSDDLPVELRYVETSERSKPYNANLYWKNILKPNLNHKDINSVPIIRYLREVSEH